jgi:amidophosphoribosyltransferase
MCGIVGLYAHSPVNQALYDALTMLQHRGQDAAGIATWDGKRIHLRKAMGLVRDCFREEHMLRLTGNAGIAHVRYPTAGTTTSNEAQPFYVNSPYGIVLGHNGNLTNAEQLTHELFNTERRHINTGSDSEALLNVFASELAQTGDVELDDDAVFEAIARLNRRVRGAYAVVTLVAGYGIVAFRDPLGIRPLVYGHRPALEGRETMVASESVALDLLGFKLERSLEPGEALVVRLDGRVLTRQCAENPQLRPCIFEWVYLARPDSIADGISVHETRVKMGQFLARRIVEERPDHGIDVVIPIPDTSRTAALALAETLGVPFREGFIKNRYIGRTFIMPGQKERKKSVRQKLNPIASEFAGRNVLLVDDSIVRGTTCQQIVQLARESGATNVYFASAAPPVRFPNVYGIDMPAATELIATGRTPFEVQREISADWLIYQRLDDLYACIADGGRRIEQFDDSIFTGKYVTGDVDAAYLSALEAERNDGAKERAGQLSLGLSGEEEAAS